MRIALLSYNARAGDAIGNQVAEKLAFFLDRGADVRVLVESATGLHPALRPYCVVVPATETRGEGWRFLSSADLVVVEYGQSYRLLELLPLLAGGKGRILFDYHGVTPVALWPAHNREAVEAGHRDRGLVWCADAALAHSPFTRDELATATVFPAEWTKVLGHPIDRTRFCPGPATGSFRERLGLGAASVLLFVGRLAPNKALPTLIEALALLQDQSPAVHAVIVGDDTDVYQAEARRCRLLAAERGVTDRLHIVGRCTDQELPDIYRSADLLVMPSRHEGFCIPVIEAMACGLPVVAARATALPQTIGGAGLTFHPDDPADLARHVRRVLDRKAPENRLANHPTPIGDPRTPPVTLSPCHLVTLSRPLRLAVVSFRYGTDFVGGAEKSLRTMAECLHHAGHHVEVFTTCTRHENDWSNQLPEGTESQGEMSVHRFRLDARDREVHNEAVRAILEADGPVPAATERAYLENSIHSAALLETLRTRAGDFDAVLVGPYLFGLSLDVARALPGKTLLVPCFHDEPMAWLRAWTEYESVAGILYHSPEEQRFAENRLGINHPGGTCVGALVDVETPANPVRGQQRAGSRRYVIYCGRFSAQKGLPLLIDQARRYHDLHPDRLTFVFIGQGEVAIPRHPGLCNLGFVPEDVRRDLVAGAAALVQLSRFESLSHAVLEAWAQGTPVIVDPGCDVLAGHLARCQGGRAIRSYEEFAEALDNLWEEPSQWQELGRRGQEYVRTHYGSGQQFTDKLVAAVRDLELPLANRMRQQGRAQAARFDRSGWREQFAAVVEDLLHSGGRPYRAAIEVKPRSPNRTVRAGCPEVLVPVRLINRGTHAFVATGPGRLVVRWQILAGTPGGEAVSSGEVSLPGLIMPGRAMAAAIPVSVPAVPGTYQIGLQVAPAQATASKDAPPDPRLAGAFPEAVVTLLVEPGSAASSDSCCTPLLQGVHAALADARRKQGLPVDYTDVTEGFLAGWKRRIKRKLLNNFKHAYVDVLSRQQSAFNQAVLTALGELAECCATLDHARRPAGPPPNVEVRQLAHLCGELMQRLAASEERSARLEARLADLEARPALADAATERT
jgi:glycosyltransferase involved in cell wall biosynthesis